MHESSDGSAILRVATGSNAGTTGWGLLLEALLFTAIGAVLLTGAGLPEAGVFSVFLAAAALHGRMVRLLDQNRDAIWNTREPAWKANRRTALSMLLIFVGMGIAFALLAAWVGPADLRTTFGATLTAPAGGGDILSRRFDAGLGDLLTHNLGALAVMIVLGFVYRSYGVLLAIGWNAAVWAIVLTTLIARGIERSPLPDALFVLCALAAVTPHLMLELAGYVTATLGALFASRGATRYRPGDDRLKQVLRAAAILLILGVTLLALAALVEDRFAPWMLARLR